MESTIQFLTIFALIGAILASCACAVFMMFFRIFRREWREMNKTIQESKRIADERDAEFMKHFGQTQSEIERIRSKINRGW